MYKFVVGILASSAVLAVVADKPGARPAYYEGETLNVQTGIAQDDYDGPVDTREREPNRLSADGACKNLKGDSYKNIGSVYVPCPSLAPEGMKYICTLYSGSNCQDEIVTFDRSHVNLKEGSSEQLRTQDGVGVRTTSIKCDTVDESETVNDKDDSLGKSNKSSCDGDPCDQGNCRYNESEDFHCASGMCKSNT